MNQWPIDEAATGLPRTTASSMPMTPMTVASPIRPLRNRYMYRPMKSASGIDSPIVNVPHGLSCSALTTASPSPASAMTMMKRIAIAAVDAGDRSDLDRVISASDRPPRRTEAHKDDEVVHRAREAHAGHEPDEPRRVAELCREHRADQRPRAGDGGEVMPEQHQPMGWMVVLAVVTDVRRRRPRVVQRHDARGDEGAVVAIRDREDAENRQQDVECTHECGGV